MRQKLMVTLFALIMIIGLASFSMNAETTIISAPEHFGIKHYNGDYFNYTLSIPDDLRKIIDDFDPKGVLVIKIQIDYKLEDGNWQYTSDWDAAKMGLTNSMGVGYTRGECYISQARASLTTMFPNNAAELLPIKNSGGNFPDKAISFRVRFVTSLDRNKTYIYSDWSETYVYSRNVVKNPDELINHAPTLTSATIEKNSGGQPFLKVMTGRIPGEVQDLNAITGDGMHTEIWMKKTGEKEFKLINTAYFRYEYVLIGVDDYFDKTQQSYDAESYEIKIRYILNDLRKYPQTGRGEIIYSPFSNVYAQNMPAWTEASKWATAELTEAGELGLIPEILKGSNMTKPITREEFAELAVLLYEKKTGIASVPLSPNPFIDTTNPQILKAASLGITKGTSVTEFSPDVLINREQCATMLFRTIKAIAPDGDYGIDGVQDFSDQLDISGFAVEATKYMYKIGIILGDKQGRFMPKATSTAQQSAGYGMATREQAIAMSLRIFKK